MVLHCLTAVHPPPSGVVGGNSSFQGLGLEREVGGWFWRGREHNTCIRTRLVVRPLHLHFLNVYVFWQLFAPHSWYVW